jgi:hypothetical protein
VKPNDPKGLWPRGIAAWPQADIGKDDTLTAEPAAQATLSSGSGLGIYRTVHFA